MRVRIVVILCLSVLFALPAAADEAERLQKAETVAESWLALVDASDFSRSWGDAASLYRAAVGKAEWEQTYRAVRSPLGAIKTRKLRSVVFAEKLPGAPEGEYVVLQYNTAFANGLKAVETVTPMKDQDGSWRVSGYYIK